MVRPLDLAAWPRRATFDFYRRFDKPYFNVCTRLDLTALRALKPELPGTLTLAYHHLVTGLCNEVAPFRYRLDGDGVCIHDAVHASTTVLRPDESIAFAALRWHPRFADFAAAGTPVMQAAQRGETGFDPIADEQAWLHFTTLPWLDFTSFSHARNWGRQDSIPKFAFGRLQPEGARWTMALSIEVHHALMDGLHVGRLVQGLEHHLADPRAWFAR